MVKRVALCWLLLSGTQPVVTTLRADVLQAEDRLVLSLDVIQTSRSVSPLLRIEIQNNGDSGTSVNLGRMSADGKNFYPTAIRVRTLSLQDAIQPWDDDLPTRFSELRYARPTEAATTHRDFLVPIAPGGAYVLTTPLTDWRDVDDESSVRLKPGTNGIKVELDVERDRSLKAADNVLQESKWHGHLESRSVEIVIPNDVPRLLKVGRSDERGDDLTRWNGRVSDPSMAEGQLVLVGEPKTVVRRLDDQQIEVKVGRFGPNSSAWVTVRLNQAPDGTLTGWATFFQHTDTTAFGDDFSRAVVATEGVVDVSCFSDHGGDRHRNSGTFNLTFGDMGVINGTFYSTTVLD